MGKQLLKSIVTASVFGLVLIGGGAHAQLAGAAPGNTASQPQIRPVIATDHPAGLTSTSASLTSVVTSIVSEAAENAGLSSEQQPVSAGSDAASTVKGMKFP